MADEINVGHINLNHSRLANYDFLEFVQKKSNNSSGLIFALQEPYIYNKKASFIPAKGMIFDRSVAQPRAALYVSANINCVPVPRFISSDIVSCLWTTRDNNIRNIMIVSVYLDGNSMITVPQKLKEIVKYCEKKRLHVLFLGDFNAHSTLWGEHFDNRRGEDVEDFILENNLHGVHFKIHSDCSRHYNQNEF